MSRGTFIKWYLNITYHQATNQPTVLS